MPICIGVSTHKCIIHLPTLASNYVKGWDMALVTCKECGGRVSTKAAACPSCGAAMPKRTKISTWIFGGVFALVVGSCVSGWGDARNASDRANAERVAIEAQKTPEQRAAEAKHKAEQERKFQFVVMALKLVKSSTKNPASFEVVSVALLDAGPVCITYRGTNSFNATVTESVAIAPSLARADWNRTCANRSGQDYTYAKRAL